MRYKQTHSKSVFQTTFLISILIVVAAILDIKQTFQGTPLY